MPPIWKITRELDRFRQQVWSILGYCYEPIIQWYYDKHFNERVKINNGSLEKTQKIALFLIYQPKGVAKSIYFTCQHLIKNGYTPFIISNSNVSNEDMNLLKQNSWRVVVRPNYGYDFGGYRDGIKLLKLWKIELDRLIIMNDSIWWPLKENDQAITYIENLDFDIAGFKLFESGDKKFIQSYFYNINKKTYLSEIFNLFWINYKLTNNKYKVVKYGEKYFSYYMSKFNIKINAVIENNIIKEIIENLQIEELKKGLIYATLIDSTLILQRDELIKKYSAREEWREASIDFILKVAKKRNFEASFNYFMINYLRVTYCKKNNNFLYKKNKEAIVSYFNNNQNLFINEDIKNEMS